MTSAQQRPLWRIFSTHSPSIRLGLRSHLTDFDSCPLACSASLERVLLDLGIKAYKQWALPRIEIPFSWMGNTQLLRAGLGSVLGFSPTRQSPSGTTRQKTQQSKYNFLRVNWTSEIFVASAMHNTKSNEIEIIHKNSQQSAVAQGLMNLETGQSSMNLQKPSFLAVES